MFEWMSQEPNDVENNRRELHYNKIIMTVTIIMIYMLPFTAFYFTYAHTLLLLLYN